MISEGLEIVTEAASFYSIHTLAVTPEVGKLEPSILRGRLDPE